MATNQLSLYRGACEVLGERKIASLTEDVPVRRDLDGVWVRGGVTRCLQAAAWNFATRAVKLTYDSSYTAPWGYSRKFELPEDYLRMVAISDDERFRPGFRDYQINVSTVFAELDEIYVRFVSKDSSFGLDYSKWPENFTSFVEHDFAWRVCRKVTASGRTKQELERERMAALDKAKATDAIEEPAIAQPGGSWGRARGRRGRYYSTRGQPLY